MVDNVFLSLLKKRTLSFTAVCLIDSQLCCLFARKITVNQNIDDLFLIIQYILIVGTMTAALLVRPQQPSPIRGLG